jgi:hypothetical protein
MPNEIPGYRPEDLLETEGANKGNIKDKEIARVGAEAEDKSRSRKIRNRLDFIHRLLPGDEDGTNYVAPTLKEVTENKATYAGEVAMHKEAKRGASEASGDVSPQAKEVLGSDAANEFYDTQKKLTNERVSKETGEE